MSNTSISPVGLHRPSNKFAKELGFIVVHLGAGYHSKSKLPRYKSLCHKACKLGIRLCKSGLIASEIASEVVSILEDSDLTNAGIGSNLTKDMTIQCDAGIMDSLSGNFAGIGGLEGIRNPIRAAYELLKNQEMDYLGLIPPMILVGDGAKAFAVNKGIESISQKDLITESSLSSFKKCVKMIKKSNAKNRRDIDCFTPEKQNQSLKRKLTQDCDKDCDKIVPACEMEGKACMQSSQILSDSSQIVEKPIRFEKWEKGKLDAHSSSVADCGNFCGNLSTRLQEDIESESLISSDEETKLDTVGVICVDRFGNVSSAVSSGGLLLKQPGRIGQATCYGCGCYVAAKDCASKRIISASSVSGCGEQLIKTNLAKNCAESLLGDDDDDVMMNPSCLLENGFLKANCLRNDLEKMAGCVNIKMMLDCVHCKPNDHKNDLTKCSCIEKSSVSNVAESEIRDCIVKSCSLDLIIACTTRSFCVGYMSSNDKRSNSVLLEMPDQKKAGHSVVSQGFHYEWNECNL